MEVSQERQFLNDVMLDRFKKHLAPKQMIYDIGKSERWDYKKMLPEQHVYTLDRNRHCGADFVIDVEEAHENTIAQADGIICNGVTEQCNDLGLLFKGLCAILKPSGYILLGMCSVAYPLYCLDGFNDKFRITPQGAQWLTTRYFSLIEMQVLKRNDVPSYIYLIGKK